MSRKFFLNDCLPERPQGSENVVDLFKEMVVNYKDLRKNECLDLDRFWATREYADNVTLCGVTLRSLLNQLKSDPTLFTYASKLVSGCLPLAYDKAQLTGDFQRLIVQRFEDALNAGLLFPANNRNMELVKSDQVDRTSKVHELRHQGQGLRVYFECDADAIYIALYGSKTVHHGKDQAADFKLAKSIVQRLRQGLQ